MQDPLWITYAWADNTEGDFDYIAQELSRAGINTVYDKAAFIPGQHLWPQIAEKITESPLSGWAYLITPSSLASKPCQEELVYALQRMIETKEDNFPLIGLVHGVAFRDIPAALRTRLCIDLHGPDWIAEVEAAVNRRAPKRTNEIRSPWIYRTHSAFFGNQHHVAIEIRPRFGEVSYWRIAFPADASFVSCGTGPAGGNSHSSIGMGVIKAPMTFEGREFSITGQRGPLTTSTSAFVVFQGTLPDVVIFGRSSVEFSADWVPDTLEIRKT